MFAGIVTDRRHSCFHWINREQLMAGDVPIFVCFIHKSYSYHQEENGRQHTYMAAKGEFVVFRIQNDRFNYLECVSSHCLTL
ncbi:hypothetical protein NECAME_13607 [Necator americanus]|uniref:Uncharacterized protein n=1 Tax=Necator americanus TaxID=51031 RepID=W2SU31_NECAM|nr:hypothetical protein NECAME_13607 [Necator americanus]ETN73150.1 hypothetical protein NECAME_13607 [Necator americanus]